MNAEFIKELRRERSRIRTQMAKQIRHLTALIELANVRRAYNGGAPRKTRKLSAASRAKIAAAQRARWAKVKRSS